MAKKRKDRKNKKRKPPVNRKILNQFDEADDLIAEGEFEQAAEIIKKVLAKRPRDVMGWNMLGLVYQEMGDIVSLWEVSQKLLELDSKQGYVWFNASTIALVNQLIFSAQYYTDYYLAHFPDGEFADDARETKTMVDSVVETVLAESPEAVQLTPEDRVEQERISMLYMLGYSREGRKIAEALLARYPNLASPRNNISLAMALDGDLDGAIRLTREVLAQEPDNLHALGNLVQYLVRIGQRDEAQTVMARLRTQPIAGVDRALKVIEALTYFGDDAAVIDTYTAFAKGKKLEDIPDIILHLAAVAYAHKGNDKQARKLWEAALNQDPDDMLVLHNLSNLRLPAHERYAAWPFSLSQWVPRSFAEAIRKVAHPSRSEETLRATVKQIANDNPVLRTSIPILFERGGPDGVRFAIGLAAHLEMPELVEFATGKVGPDSERIEAFNFAAQAELIPPKQKQRMWLKGEWTELQPIVFEISYESEPDESLPDDLNDLIADCHDLLLDEDFEDGLARAERGLEQAPTNRTLLNYKTAALQALNRKQEAAAVIRHTYDLYPDYFFAQVGMAEVCLEDKKLDEAKQWIQPLMEHETLHISEFAALCMINVKLFLAEGQKDAAKSWVNMLEETDPDHHVLPALHQMVNPELGSLLSFLMSKMNP